LRIWIKKSFKAYELNQDNIPKFILSLYQLLKETANSFIDEEGRLSGDLSIILKAHSKAIKLYNIINYECFPEVISILDQLFESMT